MQLLARVPRTGRGNIPIAFPRIYPRQVALAIMFAMTAEVFYFFPGMSLPNELWNVLCFLFLCFVYLAWKAKTRGRFMGLEFYILAVMGISPLWAGIMAQHIFGQPALYGILAERQVIVAMGALALLMFNHQGWITSKDCKGALIILAWATLVLYTVMTLFALVNSNQSSTQGQGGGALFTFNYVFIQIGFFYYALIGFNRKSSLHYILAAPFLVYIISTGQRGQLLVTVGAYGLFVLIRGSFARLAAFVPSALIGLAALVGLFYLANPAYVTDLAVRTGQAITVVATGQKTQDLSANARLEETAVALPYISRSFLLGNGDISKQWHGGYSSVLNAYFFPSDVGIIGILYRFGLLGTIFFAFQFWWMRKYFKAASRGADTPPMVDAVMAFLIAYAVISLESGMYVNRFPTGVLLTVFLYVVATERKNSRIVPGRRQRNYSALARRGVQRPS